MKNAKQDLNRLRQPKVLPSSASRRWYPGNLGSDGCRGNAVPLGAESKYDFRELETSLGNVGQEESYGKSWINSIAVTTAT
jgi:hypothetical protein